MAIPRPTPSSLRTLHLLQSQLLQTSYNPTAIRTGSKYLRRSLRGPSIVAYTPPLVSLPKILRDPKYAFDPPRPTRPDVKAEAREWAAYEDNLRKCRKEGNVEDGFEEVERDERGGWLMDMREWVRKEEVDARRLIGRGKPKKGEGRRSQMKKK